MKVDQLRRALADLPEAMEVMLLGDGRIADMQIGDADNFSSSASQDCAEAVVWLIGTEWGKPANAATQNG